MGIVKDLLKMFGAAAMGFVAAGAVFVVLIILAVAYLGFFPGLSGLMGSDKPRDLGVKYTSKDYDSALAKIPGFKMTNANDWCITCPYVSKGSVPVDTEITQEEFTANLNKQTKGPIKDAQVKFNKDGTIEGSGLLNIPQLNAPVYIKGKLDQVSDKLVTFKLDYVEVGRLGMGGDQLAKAQDVLNMVSGDFFNKNSGLSVDSLAIEDGKVKFKGTYPEEIAGIPGSQPAEFQ